MVTREDLENLKAKTKASATTPPAMGRDVEEVFGRMRAVTAGVTKAFEERELRRLIAANVTVLAAELGARYGPALATLDRFRCDHPKQTEAVDRLRVVLRSGLGLFISQGRSLVFYGTVGTGKDHLLAASLYAAASIAPDCTVRWVNGQELFGEFRDRMDSGRPEEELVRKLVAPTVLGISDPIPPIGGPSPYNVSQLYRILDRRYRALKATWVSVNALSVEDGEGKLSAPVFDRLREGAEMFPCFWPSYRETI